MSAKLSVMSRMISITITYWPWNKSIKQHYEVNKQTRYVALFTLKIILRFLFGNALRYSSFLVLNSRWALNCNPERHWTKVVKSGPIGNELIYSANFMDSPINFLTAICLLLHFVVLYRFFFFFFFFGNNYFCMTLGSSHSEAKGRSLSKALHQTSIHERVKQT